MGTTRFDLRRTRGCSYLTPDGKKRRYVQFDLYTHVESDDDDEEEEEEEKKNKKKRKKKKKKKRKENPKYVMSARMYEMKYERHYALYERMRTYA